MIKAKEPLLPQLPYLLQCQIQPYAWGSKESIARLLGQPAPSSEPEAELWMGAHPKAPASLIDPPDESSDGITLDQWIEKDRVHILGADVAQTYGRLPYLFKILAAAAPLSIQAHPDKAQAERGYAAEEAAGIPRDARHRNYKDDNHKPELICALTPFWALKGFRAPAQILSLCEALDLTGLESLLAPLQQADPNAPEIAMKAFFTTLMTMDKSAQTTLAESVMAQVQGASARGDEETSPQVEAAWIERLGKAYPGDIGILAPLYLHLTKLQPGQALYLGAGELHAYLEGTGIELMANSDNVLRGGLTPKHIDVKELLTVLDFAPVPLSPLVAQETDNPQEKVFATPAPEFRLSQLVIEEGAPYQSPTTHSVEILLCLKGEAHFEGLRDLTMPQGSVCFVPASHPEYRLSGNATVYKAAVPQ